MFLDVYYKSEIVGFADMNEQATKKIQQLIEEFQKITKIPFVMSPEYKKELDKFAQILDAHPIRPFEDRKKNFLAKINRKFLLNKDAISAMFAFLAKKNITFNFGQKKLIYDAFDYSSREMLKNVFRCKKIAAETCEQALKYFNTVTEEETISFLTQECQNPSSLRINRQDVSVQNNIAMSLFSSFLWETVSEELMYSFFSRESNADKNFFCWLQEKNNKLFSRDGALFFAIFDKNYFQKSSYNDIRDGVADFIKNTYDQMSNYGFLAIQIFSPGSDNSFSKWELSSDVILFAEKFIETNNTPSYFHKEAIKKETLSHISSSSTPDFTTINEGFTYRDTFVIQDSSGSDSLLIIFQKNKRDETKIPCPACRSFNVKNNSYSSLGVKSWECGNLLCPDRSKYNRGKRFSFKSLLMQQAIENEADTISSADIKPWQRDIVSSKSFEEIVDFLIKHYSIHGDTIHLFNTPFLSSEYLGRHVCFHKLSSSVSKNLFWSTADFFSRYIIPAAKNKSSYSLFFQNHYTDIYNGDSLHVLRDLPENFADGAITSPPYYNARDYSQWSNIYCYLHDMYNIAVETFRVLKPGGIYLYNIFDYFDNENIIVQSAMGNKRIPLSAYSVDCFRRAGFIILGNIVWDKGNIEGKRGFNSGNFSPFYQAPFNCWEHILILKKEGNNPNISDYKFPSVIEQHPVVKMIKGKNTHGHTAPFPQEIPELLIKKLAQGSVIIDPFAGSCTTARVAEDYKINTICIEKLTEYCDLGVKMLERKTAKDSLF